MAEIDLPSREEMKTRIAFAKRYVRRMEAIDAKIAAQGESGARALVIKMAMIEAWIEEKDALAERHWNRLAKHNSQPRTRVVMQGEVVGL